MTAPPKMVCLAMMSIHDKNGNKHKINSYKKHSFVIFYLGILVSAEIEYKKQLNVVVLPSFLSAAARPDNQDPDNRKLGLLSHLLKILTLYCIDLT